MKRIAMLLLAAAVVMMPSCKNNNKKKEAKAARQTEMSQAEKNALDVLKINLDGLVDSFSETKPAPFCTASSKGIKLTDKELMAKPEYLLDASKAGELSTLSQKYRAVAMYSTDKIIAKLYKMPVDDYDAAMSKLAVDLADPALKDFALKFELGESAKDDITALYESEWENHRVRYFWEAVAAALVEQTYITTKNIDKFMPMFDDKAANDITYRFVLVHEGIKSLIPFHEEMAELNTILEPLYVINAINAEQLKGQLIELKGQIDVVRNKLLL